MKLDRKTTMILAGIALLVIILFGYWLLVGRKSNNNKNEKAVSSETVIPTVDSSVKVDLTSATGGKEVTLKIAGIPKGTNSIDYELSYQTAQQGLQGVIGTISVEDKSEYDKKLTLGTCSSGTCVYHQVVGKIKLTLKFNSDSGEKIFEKEYSL